MSKYTEPHLNNSVLITIDTQNDFTLENAPAQIAGTKDVIPNMSRLLDSYRKKGLLIIHVIRLYLPDGSNVDLCRREIIEKGKGVVIPESEGAELVEDLKPDSSIKLNADVLLAGELQQIGSNEFVIYKPRWGAFYGTRLEDFLNNRKLDTLVFSGCNYPNCPRTSIYEASERDFRVVLVKDAMSQLYPRGEEEMENIGVSLLRTHEIEGILA
ncbi:MAG: cysteine hydrolase [Candidatus Thiodiazotropha sp. (ex Cardiolucina cf. quadrata)]|nr:cysteine hydrolase [Candidatus Thiodiazotropha sp. (ex Cardiolucina cf. quadrata)]